MEIQGALRASQWKEFLKVFFIVLPFFLIVSAYFSPGNYANLFTSAFIDWSLTKLLRELYDTWSTIPLSLLPFFIGLLASLITSLFYLSYKHAADPLINSQEVGKFLETVKTAPVQSELGAEPNTISRTKYKIRVYFISLITSISLLGLLFSFGKYIPISLDISKTPFLSLCTLIIIFGWAPISLLLLLNSFVSLSNNKVIRRLFHGVFIFLLVVVMCLLVGGASFMVLLSGF